MACLTCDEFKELGLLRPDLACETKSWTIATLDGVELFKYYVLSLDLVFLKLKDSYYVVPNFIEKDGNIVVQRLLTTNPDLCSAIDASQYIVKDNGTTFCISEQGTIISTNTYLYDPDHSSSWYTNGFSGNLYVVRDCVSDGIDPASLKDSWTYTGPEGTQRTGGYYLSGSIVTTLAGSYGSSYTIDMPNLFSFADFVQPYRDGYTLDVRNANLSTVFEYINSIVAPLTNPNPTPDGTLMSSSTYTQGWLNTRVTYNAPPITVSAYANYAPGYETYRLYGQKQWQHGYKNTLTRTCSCP